MPPDPEPTTVLPFGLPACPPVPAEPLPPDPTVPVVFGPPLVRVPVGLSDEQVASRSPNTTQLISVGVLFMVATLGEGRDGSRVSQTRRRRIERLIDAGSLGFRVMDPKASEGGCRQIFEPILGSPPVLKKEECLFPGIPSI